MNKHSSISWLRQVRNQLHRPLPRQLRKQRQRLQVELLEERLTPALSVAQVTQAYGVNHIMFGSTVGDGKNQTIAIIDPGDDAALVNTGSANFDTSDLYQFDQWQGLQDPPSFTVVGETGLSGSRPTYANPASNPVDYAETTMDVEWAHAMAPEANIVLVEMTSFGNADIVNAITKAVPQVHASVVSMSFDAPEFSLENGTSTTSYDDGIFTGAGVAYIGSSGDDGNPGGYPAFSPNVLAVGATNLFVDGGSNNPTSGPFAWESETGWSNSSISSIVDQNHIVTVTIAPSTNFIFPHNSTVVISGVSDSRYDGTFTVSSSGTNTFTYVDNSYVTLPSSSGGYAVGVLGSGSANMGGSGGGTSAEATNPEPGYQNGTVTNVSSSTRAIPDVSFVGSTATPVDIYDSSGNAGAFNSNYESIGAGTSLSAPCWAGLVAIADEGLALRGQNTPLTTSVKFGATLQTALYDLPLADFHDIVGGYNGSNATSGYDFVTGIGTPIANLLIPDLAGQPAELVYTAPDNVSDHNIVVEQVGANIEITDNGTIVASHAASTTSQIDINGSDATGTISLTLNYAGGKFTIPVNYDGGSDQFGSHSMTIEGGSFANEVDSPTNQFSGTITLDNETIAYSDLQPITDTATVTNFAIHDPLVGDTINVINDPGSPQNGFTTTQVNGSGFELVNFANKTNVTIYDDAGGDTFDIDNPVPAAGLGTLTLAATVGAGDDFDVIALFPAGTTLDIDGFGADNTVKGPSGGATWNITGSDSGDISNTSAVDFADIQKLVGGGGNNTFEFQGGTVTSVDGGPGASNTIDGPDLATTWNITGANAGNISGVTSFTDIQSLVGNALSDDFVFGSGGSIGGSLTGGLGGNTLDETAVANSVVTVTGKGTDVGLKGTATAITGTFDDITNLTGFTTLGGPNAPNVWNITGTYIGTLTTFGVTITFHVPNLLGGNMTDSFIFHTGGLETQVDGNGGINTVIAPPQINFWEITGDDTGLLAGSVNVFKHIQNLTGGGTEDNFDFGTLGKIEGTIDGTAAGAASSIIVGPNAAESWSITGSDSGTANFVANFLNIANLTGGNAADTFTLTTVLSAVTGTLDGGGGNNTLAGFNQADTWDITGADSGSVGSGSSLTNPPAAINVVNSFLDLQNLVGGNTTDNFLFSIGAAMGSINGGAGSTTIVGPAQADNWNLTGPNTGNIAGVLGSFTTSPTSATLNLTGGGVKDTFLFVVGGTLNGTIDGTAAGAAASTIIGPGANSYWSVTGPNAGSFGNSPGATTDILLAFQNIANLVGGSGNDLFVFSVGATLSSLDGGGGNNTIDGANHFDTWYITAANAGSIQNVLASFADIQNLVGNSSGDTFVFFVGASLGTITGGSLHNLETIRGADQNDVWRITGPDAGAILENSVTPIVTFTAIGDLVGNVANDTFSFQTGVGASINSIDGGGGTGTDIIFGPSQNDTWNIFGTDGGNVPGVINSFARVANLVGGTAKDTFFFATGAQMGYINGLGGNDIIVGGPRQTNTYNLTGPNAGGIAGYLTTFVRIPYLAGSGVAGNTGIDIFMFHSRGSLTGRITGGSGKEWLDYAPLSTSVYVNLGTGVASFLGLGVACVPNVIGSGIGGDTIIGSAAGGVLEGHNSGNTILAGSGRSVIIGGYGKNLLEGGASDDLLIAGRTSYDANIIALLDILAEWQSTDSFATRISDLRTGASLAQGSRLILNGTVFVSATPPGPRFGRGGGDSTTLLGNGGLNWFFTLYGSTIIDLQSTDVID